MPTTKSPDSSVVEKIKKLLSLADGNQNENERENAMQLAMELLAKHNLSLGELEQSTLTIRVVEVYGDFRLEKWIRRILHTACMLYYTDFYHGVSFDEDTFAVREQPVFIGTEENIAVTIEVATWLMNSVRLESNRLYKDPKLRRSFRLGAAVRLWQRARLLVENEKNSTTPGATNGLMVIRNQLEKANEDYLDSLNLRVMSNRRATVVTSAYNAGVSFGEQVELSRRTPANSVPVARLTMR